MKTFPGGVHPPDGKSLSKDAAILAAPVPPELVVPLAQHIGRPAEAAVRTGDDVKRGSLIGKAPGFVSAAVHSPVSGTVRKIVQINTPLGPRCDAVVIESDGADAWAEGCDRKEETSSLDAKAIRDRIADAGLVGMGGATFPTHVKLSPPENKPIDTVILNGVECEPYLTADYRLMLESPESIVEGLLLAMRAVGCQRGIVGVEANKPDAHARMREALAKVKAGGVTLSAELLEVKYPQGAEKQLIRALLNREVPSGGLPMDVGVVVQNVATAHAIYEACALRRPLTERIVTVTGDGVAQPKNFRARIGTPVRVLLDLCGYKAGQVNKVVLGGPMMGLAHYDLDLPVTKGMSGLLCLTDAEAFEHQHCIRCGRCVEGCPAQLMPLDLSILIEAGRFHDARDRNLLDCIECGVCTYVCPARRPIVQWVKLAKYELAKERLREQAKAKTA